MHLCNRDFKTANVFMAEGGLLKVGDFGVSKVLSSTLALAKTTIGTPYYISPEICLNRPYNAKVSPIRAVLSPQFSLIELFSTAQLGRIGVMKQHVQVGMIGTND